MASKKIRVAIMFGGRSGEHEVSIVSATNVFKALDKDKYDVQLVGIDKKGRWLLTEQATMLAHSQNPRLLNLNKMNETVSMVPYQADQSLVPVAGGGKSVSTFDVVFPVLHGTYGEDGTMQGLLELADVAYVGSGVLGSSVGMDKDVARRLLVAAGIPCVATQVIRKSEWAKNSTALMARVKELGFPCFVKPANAGSSVGVHKIKSEAEMREKIEDSFRYDTKILLEKGVAARELEIAVLGHNDPKASIVGEIIPNHEFYSYEAKYIDENGADLKIPAENVDAAIVKKMQELAVQAFKVLELSGMARVDFFLDRNTGELFLNEVNTIPGFTQISMYPKLWMASGMTYSGLLDELIKLAIERHEEKRALLTEYSE